MISNGTHENNVAADNVFIYRVIKTIYKINELGLEWLRQSLLFRYSTQPYKLFIDLKNVLLDLYEIWLGRTTTETKA